jgi:hypothetical protein
MRLLKPNKEENKTIVIVEEDDVIPRYNRIRGTSIDELFIPAKTTLNKEMVDALFPQVLAKKNGKIFVYHKL